MGNKIKRSFLAGLATIVPVALTVYVLQVVLKITITLGGKVSEPLKQFVDVTFPGFNLLSSIIGLIVVILALILIGALARNVLGKRVVAWLEGIFKNIPLIGMIYTTTKQIMESISGGGAHSFEKVVYIEYPRKNIWTLGFVTSESTNQSNEEFYHLFVPTTPNPTSGFFLIIPKEDTSDAGVNVEEGFRMIVSSGIVSNKKNSIIK
ncbi:MAG: DUF502 domain-containing protein [Candidatus Marinimicrobia bacterium]|jgi:uncharacterized membrane protein|nr:DUF502 domain-containing protein [Candidatus Neomarinimicrobiota bacterium]|tara:strand:+ start:1234 stop:1854 length:621 start_codon:yes stop_codon:yes gene_type:complete